MLAASLKLLAASNKPHGPLFLILLKMIQRVAFLVRAAHTPARLLWRLFWLAWFPAQNDLKIGETPTTSK